MLVELYFAFLCVNPFIDLVIRLSDDPKLSVTTICADDFGSALKRLWTLQVQAPIFLWLLGVQVCI